MLNKYCSIFVLALWMVHEGNLGIAQGQPKANPRDKHYNNKIAQGMIDSLRDAIPQQSPSDIIKSLKIWKEVNERLQLNAHSYFPSLVNHKDPAVRHEAALALAELNRTPERASVAVDTLIRMLEDLDPEVRGGAFWGLGRMAPLGKPAIPKAIQAMKESDPRVRRGAFLMISHWLPFDREILPNVVAGLDDADTGPWPDQPGINSVSHLAMSSLARQDLDLKRTMQSKGAIPKLLSILKAKKGCEGYDNSALYALANLAPGESLLIDAARRWLKADDARSIEKGAGLVALLGEHGKDAVPEIVSALKRQYDQDQNKDHLIKACLLNAIERIGPNAIDALPTLEALAQTDDVNLQRSVSSAIESVRERR